MTDLITELSCVWLWGRKMCTCVCVCVSERRVPCLPFTCELKLSVHTYLLLTALVCDCLPDGGWLVGVSLV